MSKPIVQHPIGIKAEVNPESVCLAYGMKAA
jgi:hypothetical protein